MLCHIDTRRQAMQQKQASLKQPSTSCPPASIHPGCSKPPNAAMVPNRAKHQHDITGCHSSCRPDHQHSEAPPPPDRLHWLHGADSRSAVNAKQQNLETSSSCYDGGDNSHSWRSVQLDLISRKHQAVDMASDEMCPPTALSTSLETTLTVEPAQADRSTTRPLLVVSMMELPEHEDGSTSDSTSSSDEATISTPGRDSSSGSNIGYSSSADASDTPSMPSSQTSGAADGPRTIRRPRPKRVVSNQQQVQAPAAPAAAAAATSDNKLVQLLKSVTPEQLQAARDEAGLGPAPKQPPPTKLPVGAYRDYKDGMLKCNCQFPVRYRQASKDGPYQSKWFFRCPDYRFRSCFFVLEEDMLNFPGARKVHAAARRAAVVWSGPAREQWKWRLAQTKRERKERYTAARIPRMIAELPAMAEAGAWSESNLFLWLKLVLPGFDADCWMSSNKRYLYPVSGGHLWSEIPPWEPPYDFIYTDSQGVLGIAGATYYIDAKCTRGVAVMSNFDEEKQQKTKGLRSIFVSRNEWNKAAQLHNAQDIENYVIILVDRIKQDFEPRLVAVMVDPYGLSKTGMLSAESSAEMRLEGGQPLVLLGDYWGLVQPDVYDTAQKSFAAPSDSQESSQGSS